jgi:hypothetical protein
MQNSDLAKRHLFSNKVDVDLDVLGATMLYGVRSHIHSTAKNHSRSGEGMMKFAKELAYPAAFSNDMSNGPVFRLSTGSGDHSLPLRRPGDQAITEVDAITRHRPPSVRIARPIRIRVRGERGRRRAIKMQSEVESPFDVTKNSFHQIEVGIPGCMHVEQAC